MLQRRFILFVLTLCMSVPAMAAKKSVAVLNFTNYGSNDIKFLSSAIPESVSTTLSENEDINVVERRNLGRVIDELSLEQTGLVDTKDVSRAGRLAKADVLILGSISGDRNNVILTIKAVDVATSKVLDGKTIKASMADIFDKSSQAARTMAALISGKSIGRLSVSSTPSRAEVYIDGMSVGQTPIVEYKLTQGKHRVKVIKESYVDDEKTVDIRAGELAQIHSHMAQDIAGDRGEINAHVYYFLPLNKDLDGALLYAVSYGHSFDRFLIAFEVNATYFGHDQNVNIALPDNVMDRNFLMFNFLLNPTFRLFPTNKYLQPYVGGMIGYTILSDRTEELKEEVDSVGHFFGLGANAGVTFLPLSKFSLFVETRFYSLFPRASRYVYHSGGLFSVGYFENEKLFFTSLSFGIGVTVYF